MMTENEQIEAARAYVALSNAHRLDWIFPMFDENASYSSAFTGDVSGKAAIVPMMRTFFARIPDVHWQVDSYRYIEGGCVEFAFTRMGSDIATKELERARGVERIYFAKNGLISRIEVLKA